MGTKAQSSDCMINARIHFLPSSLPGVTNHPSFPGLTQFPGHRPFHFETNKVPKMNWSPYHPTLNREKELLIGTVRFSNPDYTFTSGRDDRQVLKGAHSLSDTRCFSKVGLLRHDMLRSPSSSILLSSQKGACKSHQKALGEGVRIRFNFIRLLLL